MGRRCGKSDQSEQKLARMNHKACIVFLFDCKPTDTTFRRYKILGLSKYVDVVLIHVTGLVSEELNVHNSLEGANEVTLISATPREALRLVCELSPSYYVDLLGGSIRASLLRINLAKNAIRVMLVNTYDIPTAVFPRSSLKSRILAVAKHPKRRVVDFLEFVGRKITTARIRLLHQEMIIVAGALAFTPHRLPTTNTVVIPAHTGDYESFRDAEPTQGTKDARGVVFLEDGMTGHTDYIYLDHPLPVTPEQYLLSLERFLTISARYCERHEYIVALHPSSIDIHLNRQFAADVMIRNRTQELVRHAELVIAHFSTSISWAVLYDKPILLITSDELAVSSFSPVIYSFSEHLNVRVLNIDSASEDDIASAIATARSLDNDKRQAFIDLFLKHPDSSDRQIAQIMLDVAFEMPDNRGAIESRV